MIMKTITSNFLKRLEGFLKRKLKRKKVFRYDLQGEDANEYIFKLLDSSEPCMISRFGSGELDAIRNYQEVQNKTSGFTRRWKILRGDLMYTEWSNQVRLGLCRNAGFFPNQIVDVELFCKLYLNEIKQIDLLGSWLEYEDKVLDLTVVKIPLGDLEPYFYTNPWTRVLNGKSVLIIHPFEETIKLQYQKRRLLFSNENVLPDFKLMTIKSVQSIGGKCDYFNSWFEALDWMKNEIDKISFDIAIIGCGAYGLPLASYIKKIGKKAVHLGGSTQVLFGIKGKRWDSMQEISSMYNEYWVRPKSSETPESANEVEDACYW